jgi:hypothetical protein
LTEDTTQSERYGLMATTQTRMQRDAVVVEVGGNSTVHLPALSTLKYSKSDLIRSEDLLLHPLQSRFRVFGCPKSNLITSENPLPQPLQSPFQAFEFTSRVKSRLELALLLPQM